MLVLKIGGPKIRWPMLSHRGPLFTFGKASLPSEHLCSLATCHSFSIISVRICLFCIGIMLGDNTVIVFITKNLRPAVAAPFRTCWCGYHNATDWFIQWRELRMLPAKKNLCSKGWGLLLSGACLEINKLLLIYEYWCHIWVSQLYHIAVPFLVGWAAHRTPGPVLLWTFKLLIGWLLQLLRTIPVKPM